MAEKRELEVILPTWEGIWTDWKEKDKEKHEGKESAKHRVKKKGINLVIEELKQRVIANKREVKRYEQRIWNFGKTNYFK